LFLLKRFLRAK